MKPLNIKKVVNFVKLGYKIFEQWCIIEKRKKNSHKMYILTVLLHKKKKKMRWTQVADRDEAPLSAKKKTKKWPLRKV